MRKEQGMISIVCAGLSFALAWGLAPGNPAAQSCDRREAPRVRHESSFACDRLALTPEGRKRHFNVLGPALRSMRKAVRELPDGYEFQFPADSGTIAMVAEWAAGERLCCPFFDIQLHMEPEAGPLWLRLTGREGTKNFIQADGASWIKP